jgi:hypothetical protein
VVKLLCEYCSSNVHVRDYHGVTPLLYAVEQKASLSVIETLLSHGADPRLGNNYGETVLYRAAVGFPEILDFLLDFKYANGRFFQYTMGPVSMALNLCVARCDPEAWSNLARAFRNRKPISFKKNTTARYVNNVMTDGHLDGLIPFPLDHRQRLDWRVMTYEKLGGQYLLRTPCQRVEGTFELSAIPDEIEHASWPIPPVHAEEPKRSTRLSEAAAALLEGEADGDLMLRYEYEA